MSMTTWHIYGVGINVDKINPPTREQIIKLLDTVPRTKKLFMDWLADSVTNDWYKEYYVYFPSGTLDIESTIKTLYNELSLEDIYEIFERYDFGDGSALSHVIRCALEDKLNVSIVSCMDCNTDESYVLFGMCYPWDVLSSEHLSAITSIDILEQHFSEVLSCITTQPLDELDWRAHSVEGCG